MTRTFDGIVIGGGIVGTACAYDLALRGLRIGVIEPGPIGGGATAAGMGHIAVMDDSAAQFALTAFSQNRWESLYSELPPDCELERCGAIWVAADSEEMAEVKRKQAYYSERAVSTLILDSKELANAEPSLRKGLAGGLLVPGDSVVYAPRVAAFLMDRAAAQGAKLVRGAVATLTEHGVRLVEGEGIHAGFVINAAGANASFLTPGLPIRPRKGHLVITDRYPGTVNHQLIELGYLKSAHSIEAESVAFNVQPRATGQLLVGSSRGFANTDRNVEGHMLHRMVKRAIEYMPELARASAIRVWTGFRAATPDKLPLVGPMPGMKNVFLATGHEGLGITTSLGTSAILADLITGQKPAIDHSPYLPERCLD